MVKYQESAEMYLETILLLKNKSSNVHAVNIAEELNYSRASVSRGVGLLVKKGLITVAETGEINFTSEGKTRAEEIYDRHKVITKLLEIVGATREVAEDNACRIEHVITPELFEILKSYVNKN